jgi:hypothetical protein
MQLGEADPYMSILFAKNKIGGLRYLKFSNKKSSSFLATANLIKSDESITNNIA